MLLKDIRLVLISLIALRLTHAGTVLPWVHLLEVVVQPHVLPETVDRHGIDMIMTHA